MIQEEINKYLLAPGITLYKSTKKEVNSILSLVEPAIGQMWKPSQGVNTKTYENEINQSRKCFDHPVSNNSFGLEKVLFNAVDNWIQPKIDEYVKDYNVENIIAGPYIFIKYQNNDKFDWHIDDGKKYPRTVSVSAYLNDDYTGGEIEFKHFNISYKPEAGDVIIFSSSYPYLHRVVPVIEGTRYAIVNWYRYDGYPAEMSKNV